MIREFVATGKLDLRFFNVAYEPDNNLGRASPTHGDGTYFISAQDPRIARVALGTWEVDPGGYWRFFRHLFVDPPGWGRYDDLRQRLNAVNVDGIDEIIRRAKTDRYEDELRHVEDAAENYGIPFTPTLALNGGTTAPHHDSDDVLSWIRHRLPEDGTSDTTITTSTSGSVGEVGSLRTGQPGEGAWNAVGLSRSDPVVVSKPLSFAGGHPAHPRLRNVRDGGYEFQIEEWDYLDGGHTAESLSYLAFDTDAGTLSGGMRYDAGRFTTDESWTDVAFNQAFRATPVVLSQAQTYNGPDAIVTRQKPHIQNGRSIRLQESEANGAHTTEVVGYVAVEPGTATLGGAAIEAGHTDVAVSDGWHHVDFARSYRDPAFVADIETTRGNNTAGLRYRNLTGTGVDVCVEEARSADSETNHVAERVGYVVSET